MTDDLTTLFHDAVEDVEPTDRLGAIRQQTHRPSRSRWYAIGGAVLVTAAVVTGIAIAVQPSSDPGPSPAPQPTANDSGQEPLVAIYYLGDTPSGPRLFREFVRSAAGARLENVGQIVEDAPKDSDYRTLWPSLALGLAHRSGDVVQVPVMLDELHDRPAGMSRAEAELAVQAVVYTVTANVPDAVAVQFVRRNGNPIDQVLGVSTSEPLARAPQLDVLALVNITNPTERRTVEGSFSADGVASSFEGTVHWRILDSEGQQVAVGVAQGSMEDHLTPWETGQIDVSGLEHGSYVFEASTDDPSAGEGPGPTVDTRSITIQ